MYYWVNEIKQDICDLNDLPRSVKPVDEQLIFTIYGRIRKDPFSSAKMIGFELNADH